MSLTLPFNYYCLQCSSKKLNKIWTQECHFSGVCKQWPINYCRHPCTLPWKVLGWLPANFSAPDRECRHHKCWMNAHSWHMWIFWLDGIPSQVAANIKYSLCLKKQYTSSLPQLGNALSVTCKRHTLIHFIVLISNEIFPHALHGIIVGHCSESFSY